MAGARDIVYDILANDKASHVIDGITGKLDGQSKSLSGWQAAAAGASAAVVGGLTVFAGASVKAYSEAQTAQEGLAYAFEQFPALAGSSLSALQEYNAELAKKVTFDDDAIASGQSVLAQFGLTGDQLKAITPLVADYAAKTGKDFATAAEDIGKAMLGQGRALKEVGVDFEDTGTAAGNFDQLMAGLSSQVGGYAEQMGGTAAGRLDILKNQFGELQESVGEKLLPALTRLTDRGLSILDWANKNTGAVQALGIAVGVLAGGFLAATTAVKLHTLAQELAKIEWLRATAAAIAHRLALIAVNAIALVVRAGLIAWTAAQWLLNVALNANPIGLIVIAITALVGAILWAWNNVDWFRNGVTAAFQWIKNAIQVVADWWTNTAYPAISAAITAVGQFFSNLAATVSTVWQNISNAITTAWNWVRDNVFAPIQLGIKIVGVAFDTAREQIAQAWQRIQDAASAAWQWIDEHVFEPIRNGIDTVREAFDRGVELIGQAWDSLREKAEAPVRFIIDTVLNNGIIRAINNVAKFLTGSDVIDPISYGGAGGSAGSGSGQPAGFGGVLDFIAGLADGVVDLITDPVGFVTDLGKNLLGGLASNPFTAIFASIPGKIADWVKEWITSLIPQGVIGQAGRVLPAGSYSIGMPFLGYPGHYGADYPAPRGTPVFAATAGIVSRAASLTTSYGRHVFIDSGTGIQTRYAHLNDYVVAAGQPVVAGQLIGHVDSTGNSTGDHLHFEWWQGGRAVDPNTLGLFDRGGWLGHGGLALNLSGRPERVLTPRSTEAFDRLVSLLDRSDRMITRPDPLSTLHGATLRLVGVDFLSDSVAARIELANARAVAY